MKQQELNDYLVNEAEYSIEQVEQMSDYEKFSAYLEYEGLIGPSWPSQILDVLSACPNVVDELCKETAFNDFNEEN